MIGVVGPSDSVGLILRLGREAGLEQILVPAIYDDHSQAASMVMSLLPVCPVVLCSGRLPYQLAIEAGVEPDRLEFIPHEGADLFLALARTALESNRAGGLPRFSFDTIPEADVREAYEELNLDSPHHVIALESGPERCVDVARIVAEHEVLLRSGAVDRAATCIHEVHQALSARGHTCLRVIHSRTAVRQALARAKLRCDLARVKASHTAICLISANPSCRLEFPPRNSLVALAERLVQLLEGQALRDDGDEIAVISTREAVARHLFPRELSPAEATQMRYRLSIGFGANVEQAGALARRAREVAPALPLLGLSIGEEHLLFETLDPDDAVRERQSGLEIAHAVGLSPVIVRRLLDALRTLDPVGFTAAEFAQAYRVEPRSARRLVFSLKERGLVEERGVRIQTGAGRPEAIYRLRVDRLTKVAPSSRSTSRN